jgi:competence protein ComEC
MSSAEPRDESANCTPASEGDIAVFPADAADLVPEAVPPPSIRIGPLVPLAVAFGLGIAAAPALPLGPAGWAAAALLGLAVAAVGPWVRLGRLRRPALVAGFFCLGAHAVVVAERGAPPHHVSRLPEAALVASLAVEGWVARPPDPQPPDTRDTHDMQRTRFVAEVTHLTLEGRRVPATGRARLTVLGPPLDVRYGDEVRGTFRLRHPRRFDNPGAFDYPAYLASQGVFLEGWTREPVEVIRASQGSRLLAAIFGVRTLLLQRLDAAMPPAQAGLLKATVLGDRSGLTPEMNRAFLDSGTYHILAISGLNVSLLAGALFGLFRLLRASPRWAAGAAAVLVTFYAALAGAGPSVIRAAVMADVYLLAVLLDRRADLLNSLALSGLAILWWNPRFLHDVGFQLTFLATLGIILVLPRCQSRLVSLPRPLRWILESVAITVAATAATLPILAGSFNRVSPSGLLANIPIVPLSGLITGLGTAACAIFLAVPTGLAWLNQVNGWLVDALLELARWFGAWSWSTVRVYAPTTGMLLCYYATLAAVLWAWPARPRPVGRGRFSRSAVWVSVGCCALLAAQILWRLYPAAEDSRVRLTMLDVGQGEAIYLEVPGRSNMLVDAGGMLGEGFDIGQRVIVPFLWHEWVNRLDVVVLTHPQSDHIGGAPTILREFTVGEVWTGGSPATSATDVWIQEYLRHRRIPHRVVAAGDPPLRWGHAVVQVIHPAVEDGGAPPIRLGREPGPNDLSVVLRVQSGDQAILLTGDLERSGEAALLGSGATLAAQVLKVPHHGSRQSSIEAFLRAVGPAVALVSVGHRNPFRHPHPEIVARYQAAGIRVWRTDRNGAISVEMQPGETRVRGRRED